MCGIFGVVSPGRPPSLELLDRGCDAMRHRGPDDRGALVHGPFGIAMTRLAIIDLAGGHQPMTTPDGRHSIVFNGEVYNFRELKAELEGSYPFTTRSDTEVVLAGFARWGDAFFARLDGIFAVAILDRADGALTLARDHFGIKPLYLHEGPGGLVGFASELKPILHALAPALRLDRVALHQVLSSAYAFTPRTLFEEIRQVPAGHVVRVAADGSRRMKAYWELRRRPAPAKLDLPTVRRELIDRVRAAVRRQLVADVPIGLLLSSGTDSMTLLALMSEAVGGSQPIETFTVVSDSADMDEGRLVKQIDGRFPVRSHFIELGAREIEASFDHLATAFDGLEVLPNSLGLFFAAEAAGKRLKVVLAGNGGDELFFGYPTYSATRWQGLARPFAPLLRAARRALPVKQDRLSLRFKLDRLLEGLEASSDEEAHYAWRSIATRADRRALTAGRASAFEGPVGLYPVELLERARTLGFDGLDAYSWADVKSWLVDSGFMMWDKAGMAHSLEIRLPLMDRELVEWTFSLPHELRARDLGRKGLLREAIAGVVPDEILRLKKRGFHLPIAQWLAGPLHDFMRERTRALPDDLIDGQVVERLWTEHMGKREDHGYVLWMLACLSSWYRQLAAPALARRPTTAVPA